MAFLRRPVLASAPALIAALAALLTLSRPVVAAEELDVRTLTAYDVAVDGAVQVSIAATVTNRDPSTARRQSGRVFFYTAAGFAIHDAAQNLRARSGTSRLAIDTRDRDDPLRIIAVRFGRELYFNESIDLVIEYELASVRSDGLLVNPQYAFVPAVGQGSRSLLKITAPAERAVTVASSNCARVGEQPVVYACGASTVSTDYVAGGRCAAALATPPAWECGFAGPNLAVIPFEAKSSELVPAIRSTRVALAGREVEVRVQHFTGDEAWAARVEDLVRRGLPVLEAANGFPYPGPATIELRESGYRETKGYEGLARAGGVIHLTPVVSDQTVLHEVSHLWSGIFASRWIAEGIADYTANIAAQRLGLRPEVVRDPVPAGPRLDEWGPLRGQIAVSRQEREAEEAGYARALRFVDLLAERVGPGTLATAGATLARERQRATSRGYLDLLEDLSGRPLTPLFAEWVLTDADTARLPARHQARAEVAAVNDRAARLGFSGSDSIDQAMREWDFDRAQRLLGAARATLDRYEHTRERAATDGIDLGPALAATYARDVERAALAAEEQAHAVTALSAAVHRARVERSPLMRVGLAGSDLAEQEQRARTALAQGDYVLANAAASALLRGVERAERDGAIRVGLLAGGLIVTLAVFGARRARPARATRQSIAG